MGIEHSKLDSLQKTYRAAVEDWIYSIRKEESPASEAHSMNEIDQWEKAHFEEDQMRNKVLAAKAKHEDALREKFFGF
jgi:hypothetical protein